MGRRGGGRWGAAEDAAFLKALAGLGHVGRAAAAIGWTSPTAYERRRRCPEFAARWAALAKRPPPDLEALVTRPHRVNRDGTVRPIRVRRVKPWTDQVEADFLDILASTCNVSLAARAIGFHTENIYRRRRENPAFERRWQAALAQGYARLEMEFLRASAEAVEGTEYRERAIGPISADSVLRLLAMHRNEVKGQGRRPGTRPQPPSIDEVKAEILRRAAAIRAARPGSNPGPGSGADHDPDSGPDPDPAPQ